MNCRAVCHFVMLSSLLFSFGLQEVTASDSNSVDTGCRLFGCLRRAFQKKPVGERFSRDDPLRKAKTSRKKKVHEMLIKIKKMEGSKAPMEQRMKDLDKLIDTLTKMESKKLDQEIKRLEILAGCRSIRRLLGRPGLLECEEDANQTTAATEVLASQTTATTEVLVVVLVLIIVSVAGGLFFWCRRRRPAGEDDFEVEIIEADYEQEVLKRMARGERLGHDDVLANAPPEMDKGRSTSTISETSSETSSATSGSDSESNACVNGDDASHLAMPDVLVC